MYWALFKNEMHKLLPETMILVALTLAVYLIVYYKATVHDTAYTAAVVLLGLTFLVPFLASFKVLSQEWSHQTIYLILSLPASGALVLGAKLAALSCQLLIGNLIAFFFGCLLIAIRFPLPGPVTFGPGTQMLLATYLSFIVSTIFLICISFLSQIVGRLRHKLSKLITLVTFLVPLFLYSKLFFLIISEFNIMKFNPLSFQLWRPICYLLLEVLAAVVIFVIASMVYDNKLEL